MFTIYCTEDFDLLYDIKAENPEISEEEAFNLYMSEMENVHEDQAERMKRVSFNNDIVCFAKLGLWNGSRKAYKIISSGKLKDCLSVFCGDDIKLYVEDNELKGEDIHHDGTNHYIFRELLSDSNEDDVYGMVYRFDEDGAMDSVSKAIGEKVTNALCA